MRIRNFVPNVHELYSVTPPGESIGIQMEKTCVRHSHLQHTRSRVNTVMTSMWCTQWCETYSTLAWTTKIIVENEKHLLHFGSEHSISLWTNFSIKVHGSVVTLFSQQFWKRRKQYLFLVISDAENLSKFCKRDREFCKRKRKYFVPNRIFGSTHVFYVCLPLIFSLHIIR